MRKRKCTMSSPFFLIGFMLTRNPHILTSNSPRASPASHGFLLLLFTAPSSLFISIYWEWGERWDISYLSIFFRKKKYLKYYNNIGQIFAQLIKVIVEFKKKLYYYVVHQTFPQIWTLLILERFIKVKTFKFLYECVLH